MIADVVRAQRDWKRRTPGYYVINSETVLAVAGPFEKRITAVDAKRAIDNRWAGTPDVLTVHHLPPGSHGGQGKGIKGRNVCRRCGAPYDGVTAHGPGHCDLVHT